MRRDNRKTARLGVIVDGRHQSFRRRSIERSGRLVEEPNRTMRHEKPCQAKPAFLSGREVGCGKFSQIFQSEMAERRLDAIRGRLLGIEIRIPEP